MSVKRLPDDGGMNHKKKTKAKGLPRADHKHKYETVLLHSLIEKADYKTGNRISERTTLPTKVCALCGRVGHVDNSPEYYVNVSAAGPVASFFLGQKVELSDKALSLPEWHTKGFFAKFASKIEEAEWE